MIEINGAFGEGGGQILRTSLTLSALTGKPLRIHHIRANRGQPGLRPQHLTAVKAIAKLTNADLKGARRDSQEVTLIPVKLNAGRFHFDIQTAGALTLVLQTIFLPLSFAENHSQVTLTGGTHVRWSPNYHYIQEQWLLMMQGLGFRAQLKFHKAGFYPQGGGEASIKILPVRELQPFICVERGELLRIRGLSGVANLPDDIAKRQKHQALKRLYDRCPDSKIKTLRLPSHGKGTFILLQATFSNCGSACYTALGEPGKPAERVADEVVDQMLAFLETDGCLDHYLSDQILLPLATINGHSEFRTNKITQHLITNVHVIQQFLPVQIEIDGELDQPGYVRVTGAEILSNTT